MQERQMANKHKKMFNFAVVREKQKFKKLIEPSAWKDM